MIIEQDRLGNSRGGYTTGFSASLIRRPRFAREASEVDRTCTKDQYRSAAYASSDKGAVTTAGRSLARCADLKLPTRRWTGG